MDLDLDKDLYIHALEVRLQGVIALEARLQAAVVELYDLRARVAAQPTRDSQEASTPRPSPRSDDPSETDFSQVTHP